jgi:type IV pilus assembly protein PilF
LKRWAAVLLPLVVIGCASNRPEAELSSQGPVSQQVAVGDARQRAKAHVDLGLHYLRDNQLNVAMDEARTAIEADSSYPLGYNLLGLVQMYLKENRVAEESFSRALRLAPGDPEINNNFGWFLCHTGRERQSISYFEAASKSALYATPTKPLTNAAMCLLGIDDRKGAEDYLVRALRADPQNADAEFILADLYYRTGRLMEARQRLADRHRKVEPTAQTAWLGLRLERKLGDRESEVRYATMIRRNFPKSREYDLMMQGSFE